MLHSGGKFSDKAYATSGGLHGVGVSVVNALSSDTVVEVARNKQLYRQSFARGLPTSALDRARRRPRTGAAPPSPSPPTPRFSARRRGSSRRGSTGWRAPRPICSPASRYAGAAIPRSTDEESARPRRCSSSPAASPTISRSRSASARPRPPRPSPAGRTFPGGQGSVEWAVAWPLWGDGDASYYCNTIPTPDGGTHEQGLRDGADPGHARVRRAGRPEEGQGHPGRGRGRPAPRSCSRCSSAIRSSRARPRTG